MQPSSRSKGKLGRRPVPVTYGERDASVRTLSRVDSGDVASPLRVLPLVSQHDNKRMTGVGGKRNESAARVSTPDANTHGSDGEPCYSGVETACRPRAHAAADMVEEADRKPIPESFAAAPVILRRETCESPLSISPGRIRAVEPLMLRMRTMPFDRSKVGFAAK